MGKEENQIRFYRKKYFVLLVLFLFFFLIYVLAENRHKDISLSEFLSSMLSDPLERQEKKILKDILGSESESWRIYRLDDKVDVVYPVVRVSEGNLSLVISPKVASPLKFDFAVEKGLFSNKCILDDNVESGNVILFKLGEKEVNFFPLLYNRSGKFVDNDFVDVIVYDEKGVYGFRKKLSSNASKLAVGLLLGAIRSMLIKVGEDPTIVDDIQENVLEQFEDKQERRRILLVKSDELIDFIRSVDFDYCLNRLR